MCYSVFSYGSLLFADVMQAVTGKLFPSQSATLREYARYCVRGASYPGIVPTPGASVEGQLYQDVDPAAVKHLDFFEGDLYERVPVGVDTDAGIVRAQTYIIPPDKAHHLSRATWDPDAFRARDYDTFLKQCKPLFRGGAHARSADPFRGENPDERAPEVPI